MINQKLRVANVLVGNVERPGDARTKYALLFEEMARRCTVTGIIDTSLRGPAWWLNAVKSFYPNWRLWRERFHKNAGAFRLRSRSAAEQLRGQAGPIDVALQIGVLFDARWGNPALRSVIYTDHTAQMSARNPLAEHSRLAPRQRREWHELEMQAYQRAAHICTRGQRVRESIIADYGIPAEKVTAIGGGVNLAVLPQGRPPRPERPPTALFIGKELHRKGGDVLLRAFARVRAHLPKARLLFLTADPIPGGLPLEGVTRMRPTWNRSAIAALYEQADVFVLPSRLETWGDVLLEAMAYQLPCIGISGQMMEDIIVHGETGLIVPPEDVTALANALENLLSDRDRGERLGQAGYRRVEKHFTWASVVDRLMPFLEAAPVLDRPK